MKRLLAIMMVFLSLLGGQVLVEAEDIDYSIEGYRGDLTIHEDNTASFEQTIVYDFDSSYNGQYVSLGTVGNMPEGFDIMGKPYVLVEKNGQVVGSLSQDDVELEALDDEGYRLKIYNAGVSGDRVEITVRWQLQEMTFVYEDIAELNWLPITDWDEELRNVSFTIRTDGLSEESGLFAHRGYLKPSPLIDRSQGVYTVKVDSLPAGQKLELHAYWSNRIFYSHIPRQSGKRLAQFKKQEAQIAQRDRLLRIIFLWGVPSLILIVVFLAIFSFIRLKRSVTRYENFPDDLHLYEAPEALSPLELSKTFANKSFYDLLPDGSKNRSPISFENLLEASLLDLIDRQALQLSEVDRVPYLSRIPEKEIGLKESERSLLDLAFAGQTSLPVDQLFATYHFDEGQIKQLKKRYHGKRLEQEVRRAGSQVTGQLKKKGKALSDLVNKELEARGFTLPYRDLTQEEEKLKNTSIAWSLLSIFICLGGIVYLAIMTSGLVFAYVVGLILSILLLVILQMKARVYLERGAVTEEGHQRLKAWHGFRQMIRDIETFERVDIEGLVIWNRLLVYASLFGYADRVEKYLTFHQIDLGKDHLALTSPLLLGHIGHVSHGFSSHVSAAHSATHFSVSSGSGGGGFSGGGGGGGGGAF